MKTRSHSPVPAICGLLAFFLGLLSESVPSERFVQTFTPNAFGFFKALNFGGQRYTETCKLVKKETLVEGKDRGEPVRRFTFQAPAPVNVSTGLRQVVVVLAPAGPRMYSPTSEPLRADCTFELVVRVYRKGSVSRWLDSLHLGDRVKMMWPWPCPLPEGRRNPGPRVGLIAFGIGVTELYRTAVQELADPAVEEVVLLYATRSWEEQQVLGAELEELQKREPKRFRLERILSREKRSGLRHGRVDPALLKQVFPWQESPSKARFVCAGTSQMMDMAYEYLRDLGYEQPEGFKLIRDAKLPGAFDLFRKLANFV